MIGWGVYTLVTDVQDGRDPVNGLWWIVLGWMLGGAARAAVAQSELRRAASRASRPATSWIPSPW